MEELLVWAIRSGNLLIITEITSETAFFKDKIPLRVLFPHFEGVDEVVLKK